MLIEILLILFIKDIKTDLLSNMGDIAERKENPETNFFLKGVSEVVVSGFLKTSNSRFLTVALRKRWAAFRNTREEEIKEH